MFIFEYKFYFQFLFFKFSHSINQDYTYDSKIKKLYFLRLVVGIV